MRSTTTARRTAALIATLACAAAPALAAQPVAGAPHCSFGDLTGVTVTACSGFLLGNLLQGSVGSTVTPEVAAALGDLGMAQPASATYIDRIGSNAGSFTVDFGTPLRGDTIVGIRLAAVSSRFGSNLAGGATAFYRFDAGSQGLDTFELNSLMSNSLGVAVFQTSPVPEPAGVALLLAGLAVVGAAARRRR